jgi:hypothetical protein
MAVDAQIEPVRGLGLGDGGDVAVIDRLLKPAFGRAALEPGTPQRATGKCAI